ncbi:response regulator receiver modulated diguanylate cyclase [Shimia gijangensis]|uniref:diguanylate cyclase n=1 Tax=Shimia gijangensis TaxID=1470563 RepID=A0A1M6LK47_9RHOB|nr:diguanylate cyclase [Shimia gijangensis]SHJ71553.1 response regulator receiver modulated diguanylate cyclase [Shimia gijangensis]
MPGKILIIDSVPTNRIVMKVKLCSAFYQVVQAGTLNEALNIIRIDEPDLVVVGSENARDNEGLNLCASLKASTESASIPMLLLTARTSREFRMKALQAGADDVFAKPVKEAALLARIRSLLRTRDVNEEWRLKDRTSRVLGFAEQPISLFENQATILFATPDKSTGLRWRTHIKPLVPFALLQKPLCETLSAMAKIATPDAFVIALDASAPEEGLRLLAEIRARATTRHCGVLVVLENDRSDTLIDALDLGANDVMAHGFDPEEMAVRLSSIVKHKRFRDGLRRNVQEGLEAAVTDPLTGLFNRRYALPHLKRIAEFSSRTKRDFAVMVADLDHFKAINDRYGHVAGDRVLEVLSGRLRDTLRPVDLLARIGGEEFLIVLPATDRATARNMADRLCRVINREPVHIQKSDIQIPVTVSIGVAMASDHSSTGEISGTALLDHADRALYGAKSTGRNQVTLEAAARPVLNHTARGH